MNCKICGEECTSKTIGPHIRHHHDITAKDYFDKYIKQPGDGVCPCGKQTRFISISDGYRRYCSLECRHENRADIQERTRQTCMERYGDVYYNNPEKYKQTCMERYGTERVQSTPEVRNKVKQTWANKTQDERNEYAQSKRDMWARKTPADKDLMVQRVKATKESRYGDANYNNQEQCKQTCLERYGVDNVFKLKDIQERITKRIIELYGVGHPAQSPEVVDKMKATSLSRYGVEFFVMTDEFKKNISAYRIQKTISDNIDILGHTRIGDDIYYIYKCPHPECTRCQDRFYISKAGHKKVRENQGTEVCTNILPISYDQNTGTSIELFVRGILDEYSIEYIANDRTILSGKELDIYIPSRKLAIECNGIYWHSLKPKEYHHEKWSACREQGIQLLTIWEDQIINKPEIIRNIILSRLGIYNERIGASKCKVQPVPAKEATEFLDNNHLQGHVNGSIRMGLYYKDRLVSIMVFGRKRKALGSDNNGNIYELYRYCNACGVQVIHGAERLFKHFMAEHADCTVESFSSNDISNGALYETLGFIHVGAQPASYWYVDKDLQRHHRFIFRKDVLVRNGADPNMTEFEITDGMGLYRIYDSGQQKWMFNMNS